MAVVGFILCSQKCGWPETQHTQSWNGMPCPPCSCFFPLQLPKWTPWRRSSAPPRLHSQWALSPGAAADAEDSLLLHGPAQRSAATGASAEPVLRPLTLGTSQAPHGASQVALVVKKPPTDAGDIRDPGSILGREDPLEEDMATHSSIFAQRIPWMEEPGRPQSMGSQRVGHDWSDLAHTHTYRLRMVSEDRGIPLVRDAPLADSFPGPPGDALWLNSCFILPSRTGPVEILD